MIVALQVMDWVLRFAYETLQVMVGALQVVTLALLNEQLIWIPQPRVPN